MNLEQAFIIAMGIIAAVGVYGLAKAKAKEVKDSFVWLYGVGAVLCGGTSILAVSFASVLWR